ncbi:MAG TPA: hypothetical protein VEZ44_16350, partial [bacterium]|nr:hypothetical protein [bacterium]
MNPLGQWREGTDALRFLATLTRGLTAALDITQVVDSTLKALHEDAGFDSSTIALIDEDEPAMLTIVGGTGLTSAFRGVVLPRPQGLNWVVVTEKRTLYIPDTHRYGQFRH